MHGRPIAPGDVVAGKYRVERVIGEGGMGIVLGAEHVTLGERVALKVLRPEALTDGEAVARFLREARAAARIKGENVARVLDVGSPGEDTPYIAMEYLEGTDLSRLVEQHGVLPVPIAIDYVLQACEALAEAHSLGIVHRDVKPSNLFLTRTVDGAPRVKVLDFGISKATSPLDAQRPDYDMTATQTVMGSPSYMAPEQMRSSRRVDGRTDIWALGTIVHELLTGRPPFEAKSMPELCAMILQDPAPSLRATRPDVPEPLDEVVAACLQKDPNARFATVQDLAAALAPFGSEGARDVAARIARVAHAPASLGSDPISGRFDVRPGGSTPALSAARTVDAPEPTIVRQNRKYFVVALTAFAGIAGLGALLGVIALRTKSSAPAPTSSATPAASAPKPAASEEGPETSQLGAAAAPPPTHGSAAPSASASASASATASATATQLGVAKSATIAKPTARPGAAAATAPATTASARPAAPPAIATSRYD